MKNTAILCVECQSGVLGPDAALPGLTEAVPNLVGTLTTLLNAARAQDIPVIHATYAGMLGDHQTGTARLWKVLGPAGWQPGSEPAAVVPALLGDGDLVLARHHGLFPTLDTELIPVIESLGVDTVIVTGVSMNVALPFTVGHLSQSGLHVVVPRDAVGGTPVEFTDMALKHSVGMLASLTTVGKLVQQWASSEPSRPASL